MRFHISRSTDHCRIDRGKMLERPCDGAVLEDFVCSESYPSWWKTAPPWFFQDGRNHRYQDDEERGFKREVDSRHWFIELDSIDALVRLAGAVGDEIIVTNTCIHEDSCPGLEIYDGYRE